MKNIKGRLNKGSREKRSGTENKELGLEWETVIWVPTTLNPYLDLRELKVVGPRHPDTLSTLYPDTQFRRVSSDRERVGGREKGEGT